MKKINFLLLLALLFCITATASAQIKFGIKGALNFNDYKTKTISLDNTTGWQAGIMTRFNLPIVGIGVQPEVLFTHKSTKHDGETLHANYLQIPLNAIWTFGIGNIHAFFDAGPYFSYAVDIDKAFKAEKFDWGLGLGAGLDIRRIHAGVRYDWGLQDIAKDGNEKIKNKAFSLFIGYFF